MMWEVQQWLQGLSPEGRQWVCTIVDADFTALVYRMWVERCMHTHGYFDIEHPKAPAPGPKKKGKPAGLGKAAPLSFTFTEVNQPSRARVGQVLPITFVLV
jgi:hypothetical protein